MDGDNNSMPQDQAENVQTQMQGSRVRIGYVFLAVVPVAVIIAIQSLAQIPFLILATVDVLRDETSGTSDLEYLNQIMNVFNSRYATYMYLIYVVVAIAVFLFWYYKGFVSKKPKVKLKEIFGTRSVVASIGIALSLYFFINAVLTLVSWISPEIIDSYNELMEEAGLMSNSVMTIFYAVILGPIAEELCFRGVVFGILEKSGVRPVWIIGLSAIMFGVMHLIPVQVLYATFIGLFFGFLRYRYRSVILTIVVHILFNLSGTYIGGLVDSFGLGDGAAMIFGGIAAIVLVFAVVMVNGDKKAYKQVRNS